MMSILHHTGLIILLFLFMPARTQQDDVERCLPILQPFSEGITPSHREFVLPTVDVSPDGQTLALVSWDALMTLYNTDTWAYERVELAPLNPDYQPQDVIAWSNSGDQLAVYVGPENGILIVGTASRVLYTYDYYTRGASTLAWSPDDSRLAALGDLPWRVWEIATGEVLYERPLDTTFFLSPSMMGYQEMAAWSPDGLRLAITEQETISILDTATWETVHTLTPDLDRFVNVVWLPGGNLIITGAGFDLEIWNGDTGAFVDKLTLPGSAVAQVSPDETLVAIAGSDTLSVLTVEGFEPVFTTQTAMFFGSPINKLDWLGDERVIIFGGLYGTVEVWNIETGLLEQQWRIVCQ
jgi:WD40 repeat protein